MSNAPRMDEDLEELLDGFESNISGRATFGQNPENRMIWQGWVDAARDALRLRISQLISEARAEGAQNVKPGKLPEETWEY